jgi:fatty-acyl-CoA synthase
MGEIMFKGNTLKGLFEVPRATKEVVAAGFIQATPGRKYPTAAKEDRAIAAALIISGGENTSSIEVEMCCTAIPDVLAAAVVAKPGIGSGVRKRNKDNRQLSR